MVMFISCLSHYFNNFEKSSTSISFNFLAILTEARLKWESENLPSSDEDDSEDEGESLREQANNHQQQKTEPKVATPQR